MIIETNLVDMSKVTLDNPESWNEHIKYEVPRQWGVRKITPKKKAETRCKMSNKTNIEEDIEIWKELIEQYKDYGFYGIIKPEKLKALENILADREEWKTKAEWFKRCCNKNFDTAQQLQTKANKYDSLVEKIKKDIQEYPNATYTKYYLLDCLGLLDTEKEN